MSDIQLFRFVPAEGPSIGMADAFDPLPLALISTRNQEPITSYMFNKRKTRETHESMGLMPHKID
jgi:hypothetical protein